MNTVLLLFLLTQIHPAPVKPSGQAYLSPADVYAETCERADERKPWSSPTPIPGNTLINRMRE